MIWIYIACGVIALLVFLVWKHESGKSRRRRELLAQPMPERWDEILRRNFPLYNSLPDGVRKQLGGYVNAFLAEKNFEPCGGLEEVTEEMRVTLAGQACLLLLNGRNGVFERLRTILLYPDIFVAGGGYDEDGFAEGQGQHLGESWSTGSVVLSWHHVLHGPEVEEDGHNVVLHEFAHQLDQIDGSADGAPTLASAAEYREWAQVFGGAYEQHQGRISRRRRLVIDDYGGTNPAEFFAVSTETFFEKPKQLKKRYPDLYNQLRKFYALDPLEW